MKHINKLLLVAATSAVFVSCVDEYKSDFLPEKPEDVAMNELLNSYDVLKTYIDRSAIPNFKLGMGISLSDFTNQETLYSLSVNNFDEVTASSGMTHSAIVGDNGTMDFHPIANYIEIAQAVDLAVYGLALCSNSQLNDIFLNNSIAPIPVPKSEDALKGTTEVNDFNADGIGATYPMTSGGSSTVTTDPDDPSNNVLHVVGAQTHPTFNVTLPEGIKLSDCSIISLMFYGPGSGGLYGQGMRLSINGSSLFQFGSPQSFGCGENRWGTIRLDLSTISLSAEQKQLNTFTIAVGSATGAANYYIDDVKIDWEKAASEDVEVTGFEGDAIGVTFPTTNGGSATVAVDPKDASNKALRVIGAQTHPIFNVELPEGVRLSNCKTIKLRFHGTGSTGLYGQGMRLSINGGELLQFPSPSANGCPDGNWGTINLDLSTVNWSKSQRLLTSFTMAVGSATGAADYYIDDIAIEWEESEEIERTEEEIEEIVTGALNSWIEGMMIANQGYIKVWDVVSFPMSDDNSLMLKNAELEDNSDFYWSDYMGENYARTAVKFAREHFATNGGSGDLKLFVAESGLVNNLEKGERLIRMIQQWESDNVTTIDGISSQLRLTYSMDHAQQLSNEQKIIDLFNLLKNSGKLIRISELDINIVGADGSAIITDNVTSTQQAAISDFYTFIVSNYIDIIPADKQYGITHWKVVDESGSNGRSVGLWDKNYNRKQTFAGFVDGFE
jgi:Beta-1,4-xylanase